jgi:hypothetical protein
MLIHAVLNAFRVKARVIPDAVLLYKHCYKSFHVCSTALQHIHTGSSPKCFDFPIEHEQIIVKSNSISNYVKDDLIMITKIKDL